MGAAPLFVPTGQAIEQSQLTAFMRFCAERTGGGFPDWPSFHAFSVARYRDFWRCLVDWAELELLGDREPVCDGDVLETARFFPGARLSFVAHLLRSHQENDADRPALVALDEAGGRTELTRAELTARVLAVGRALLATGIRPGDRVCAVASSSAEVVIACLGSLAIGATWSSLSPDMGLDAIASRLGQIEPRLLFYDAEWQAGGRHPAAAKIAELVAGIAALERTVALRGPAAPEVAAARAHPAGTLAALLETGRDEGGPRSLAELPRLPFNHPLYVLFSSGTTGAPKCIVHGAGGTLLEHHKEHRLHCDLGPGDRLYFHTTPAWMMWNWLVSALACRSAIVLYEGAVSHPEPDSLWHLVARERVTAFGTGPSFLQFTRDQGIRPQALDLSALRAVLSTGSVLSEALFRFVAEEVAPVPVQSISGGTDILGCFLLGNPNLPVLAGELQCKSLAMDVGALPLASGGAAPAGPSAGVGELVCRNPFPSRPLGFLNDPEGRRFHEAYFEKNPGLWTHGDWLELSASGGGRILGRSDGVLNIRGVRIGPAEIYRALEPVAGIRAAMAIEQTHAASPGGSRLVLLLVLEDGIVLDGALRQRIVREISARATFAHVPSVIAQVSDLPVTYSGKRSERAAADAINGRPIANRAALRNAACLDEIAAHPALLTPQAKDLPPVVGPDGAGAGPALERVRALWQEALGTPVGDDDGFFELGGYSLLAVTLMGRVERAFGVRLPMSSLLAEARTVRAMAELLARGGSSRNSTLVPLEPRGDGLPAYWVPGGGGLSVLMFRDVSLRLAPERKVFGFELHARLEDAPADLPAMAARYVADLVAHDPRGPYVILGFSLGGWTAFEMTRQLEAQGRQVALLGIFDTAMAQKLRPGETLVATGHRLGYHLRELARLPPSRIVPYARGLGQVASARLRRRLAAMGLDVAPPGEAEASSVFRELDRRSRAMTLAYSRQPHVAVQARMALFLAQRTSQSALPPTLDSRYGWSGLTRGGFEVLSIDGSHLSMLRPPDVEPFAAKLRRLLAEVDRAHPGRA
jgi:acetoacetyl-CoA synthetase